MVHQDKFENGWREWSKHVLMELERLSDKSEDVCEKIEKLNTDVTILQTKTSIFSKSTHVVLSAIVAGIISFITAYIIKHY